MTTKQHEYSDWKMHFEDCPWCTATEPCPTGRQIREREEREQEVQR